MTLEHDECIKKGKIKPFSRGVTLAPKEIETARADLETARKTYKENDYKWATIQIYYSMFHSARALLYAKNLREHSHYCLIAAIKTLYVETKQIPVYLPRRPKAPPLRAGIDGAGFAPDEWKPWALARGASLEALQEAKNLREEADYYNRWSQTGCEKSLKLAEEFLHKADGLIKK